MTDPQSINRAEQAIVEMLADRIGTKLADRDGDRHAPPWRPDQKVRIGVLRPIITDAPTDDGATADDGETAASEGAGAADTEAPPLESTGVIGIDAVIDTPGSDITVEVGAAVTIYLPEFASYEEAVKQTAAQAEEDVVDEEAAVTGASTEAAGAEATNAPVAAATDTAATDTAATDTAATPTAPTRRRAGLPVWESWRRVRVAVPGMVATLRPDGAEVEVGQALRDAIAQAVNEHFQRPEAARPFTSTTRTIPLTALTSSEAYWNAIGAVVDTQWQPIPLDAQVSVYA